MNAISISSNRVTEDYKSSAGVINANFDSICYAINNTSSKLNELSTKVSKSSKGNEFAPIVHNVTEGYIPVAKSVTEFGDSIIRMDDQTSLTVISNNTLKFGDASKYIRMLDDKLLIHSGPTNGAYETGKGIIEYAVTSGGSGPEQGEHRFIVRTSCGGPYKIIAVISEYSMTLSGAYLHMDGHAIYYTYSTTLGAMLKTNLQGAICEATAGVDYYDGSGTTGRVPVYSAAKTLTNSPFFVSSGKVACGTYTTAPDTAFTVDGSITIYHRNLYGNYESLIFRYSPASNNGYSEIRGIAEAADNKGALAFLTRNAAGTLNECMRITSLARVGIGVTAPDYPLDVSGTVRCTDLIVSGYSVVDYSNDSTITGWSSFTTKKIMVYTMFNKIMVIVFELYGTSNSIWAAFTLPANAAYDQGWGLADCMDNGARTTSYSVARIASASNEIMCYITTSNPVFTASGTKRVHGTVVMIRA